MYVCVYACVYVYVCLHIGIFVCTVYIFIHTSMSMSTCVCMYMYMYTPQLFDVSTFRLFQLCEALFDFSTVSIFRVFGFSGTELLIPFSSFRVFRLFDHRVGCEGGRDAGWLCERCSLRLRKPATQHLSSRSTKYHAKEMRWKAYMHKSLAYAHIRSSLFGLFASLLCA